jgi:hypothetical protein
MTNQPQTYTSAQLQSMTWEEFQQARAQGYQLNDTVETTPSPVLSAEPEADKYAVTTWGESEYDFRVPSGQLCRMKKIQPQELAGTGLLDRITRLPGLAEEQVRKAEGQPPTPAMPEAEQLKTMVSLLEELLPLVVVKPKLHPNPLNGEDKVPGRVYVSDVDLADQIAIMERAVGGVAKMDNFRQQS